MTRKSTPVPPVKEVADMPGSDISTLPGEPYVEPGDDYQDDESEDGEDDDAPATQEIIDFYGFDPDDPAEWE